MNPVPLAPVSLLTHMPNGVVTIPFKYPKIIYLKSAFVIPAPWPQTCCSHALPYVCKCQLFHSLSHIWPCNPMCSPPGSSVHEDSPGKNTGVGCHFLLQGIFLGQGSNPQLLHWQVDFLTTEPPRKSKGSSQKSWSSSGCLCFSHSPQHPLASPAGSPFNLFPEPDPLSHHCWPTWRHHQLLPPQVRSPLACLPGVALLSAHGLLSI